MANAYAFAERVRNWLDEGIAVHEGLAREGAELVRRLQLMPDQTFKSIARRSGLSKGYLSNVANGNRILNPESFVLLSDLARTMGNDAWRTL